ncbi:MAG: DUF983 domain-containing protein [Alphaproteobacteria bacterium]
MPTDISPLKSGITCKCPQCGEGALFHSRFDLTLKDKCGSCGLDLSKNDTADGPAVFLIFILGTLLVPLALWVDAAFSWPLWVHAAVWGILTLALTVGFLKPIKAYIIALQFKHRPRDWE